MAGLNIKMLAQRLHRQVLTQSLEDFETLLSEVYEEGMKQSPSNPQGIYAQHSPQSHYDNSKGSLYKFAEDHKLNAWEFDIVKRIVRSRKKGQFKEDLQKTKDVIDIYLKEYEDVR